MIDKLSIVFNFKIHFYLIIFFIRMEDGGVRKEGRRARVEDKNEVRGRMVDYKCGGKWNINGCDRMDGGYEWMMARFDRGMDG